jgi:protocatechuate 3,4-dioxygenase beta subunit
MRRTFLAFALFATAATGEQLGSIRGTVRDALDGTPVASVSVAVVLTNGGGGYQGMRTKADGSFELVNCKPGTYQLTVSPNSGTPQSRVVVLAPDARFTEIDFALRQQRKTTLSGTVLDENFQPVSGLRVGLITRRYRSGVITMSSWGGGRTGQDGRYRIEVMLDAAAWFLIEAQLQFPPKLDTASTESPDIAMRARVLTTTFYPGSNVIDGAQALALRPGEDLQHVDFRVIRGPAYCVEGKVSKEGSPAGLVLTASEDRLGGSPFSSMGETGNNGAFRVCGLGAGRYRFGAMDSKGARALLNASSQDDLQKSQRWQSISGMAESTVAVDVYSDVRDVEIDLLPAPSITVRIDWDKAPNPEITATAEIRLESLRRYSISNKALSVPGFWAFDRIPAGKYAFTAVPPKGFYVKKAMYSGVDLLRNPALLEGATRSEILVTIGTDGGSLRVAVNDRDGHPIPDAHIYLLPADILAEDATSASWIEGQSDGEGVFEAATVAPGKYDVLAIQRQISTVPEDVRALLAARTASTQVTVEPGKAAKVEVKQVRVD